MALVTNNTKRLDIPHEPGEWMLLKRLSWRQLEMAAEIQTDATLKKLKTMGGDLVQSLRQVGEDQEQDPATKYDRGAVLQCGIVEWSYDAEVSKDTIDALDEVTAEWAFQEILELNKPRTEEERKNG